MYYLLITTNKSIKNKKIREKSMIQDTKSCFGKVSRKNLILLHCRHRDQTYQYSEGFQKL